MKASLDIAIPGKRSRPFDIGNFLLRRAWIIALVGGLLFLTLFPVAFIISKPYYRAGGRLLVRQNVKMFLDQKEHIVQGDFRDFLATKSERLRSPAVAMVALSQIPRPLWPDFVRNVSSVELAARLLVYRLNVSSVGRSHLLEVSLVAGESQGMAETINAVMDSYIKALEREQEADSERRLTFLFQELEKLLAEMAHTGKEREAVAKELTHSSFSEEKNPFYEVLIGAQRQYMEAHTELLKGSTGVAQAERDEVVIGSKSMKVFAEELVANNEAVYLIDNWTYQKLQELRSRIDGLTETNEDRIIVEDRMSAMTDYLNRFKQDLHNSTLDILERKRGFELEDEVVRSKSRMEAAQSLARQLEEELGQASAQFARSSELIDRGIVLNETLANLRNRRSLLEDRIREVKLEAKAPVHVSIEQRALPPGGADGDNLGKLLGLAFLGAFGFVGTTALAFELLDGRVKSAADLKAALGAIPLEPIPKVLEFAPFEQDSATEARSCAVRLLAVRLESERKATGAKVFLLSGTERGSGVSTLTQNLASAMTCYARKILVIKVEPDRAVDSSSDFSVLENPDRYLEEMLLAFFASSESVSRILLPGDAPLIRWRWLFTDFLQRSRTLYDAILLDVPPVLSSDLSRFLVEHSDVAILVAREQMTHYSDLRLAVELLVRLDVPAVTGVLNFWTEQPMERVLSTKTHWVEDRIPQLKARLSAQIRESGKGLVMRLREPNKLPAGDDEPDDEEQRREHE